MFTRGCIEGAIKTVRLRTPPDAASVDSKHGISIQEGQPAYQEYSPRKHSVFKHSALAPHIVFRLGQLILSIWCLFGSREREWDRGWIRERGDGIGDGGVRLEREGIG